MRAFGITSLSESASEAELSMHHNWLGVVVAVLCSAVLAKEAPAAKHTFEASIDRTSLGIPHIQAADESGLGYGIGYAYAQDNICLLADEVLTVRGERAKFLGAEGRSSTQLNNIDSDIFFRWLNRDEAIDTFRQAQPAAIRALLAGYAAGFNRYLRDTPSTQIPRACRGANWLRPLEENDLIRLHRRLLVEGGIGRFVEAVVNTSPPDAAAKPVAILDRMQDFARAHGSNAIAVGGSRTENGKGRLLANPHFPWFGGLRFYQMHLTIPGRLDAMGAALPGFPMINIGFNRNLAWTHTVDSSAHFTLHRLELDPQNSLRYRVDGEMLTLKKNPIAIEVLGADKKLSTQTRTVYESRFGPIVASADGLAWSAAHAYALQDANLGNTRAFNQWYALNQAYNLNVFRKALLDIQGVPWVNTLAVDDRGQALYANVSVVPNIPRERLSECADAQIQVLGLPGFDGSRKNCDWQSDSSAQLGLVAANRMPLLQRDDFVQSSNDSAWMTNPAAPLTNFSPLIAAQERPLRLRTRFALTRLAAQGDQPFDEKFLRSLVDNNRVYAADLVLDDLLTLCRSLRNEADAERACNAMSKWDRSANLTSGIGFLYFQAFMAKLEEVENAWQQSFNPSDPLHTPRGLATKNSAVAKQVKQALREAARSVNALQLPDDIAWGDIQVAIRNDKRIPIPGGDGALGIYNAITSVPEADHREVIDGSSYIQLVSFDEQGPVAHGLLTFSQSSDPASQHAADQTLLFSQDKFSQKQWPLLPFTAEQIAANPPVNQIRLRE